MAQYKEATIYPTEDQAQACLRVCQMLSNYYRDICLFRFDEQYGYVYILTTSEMQIIVPPSGEWYFL